ncbi:MAG: HAMP domain-containing protein, partial [Nitrospinaceae bacterium]|nr:HAMP domain-containing protein [Nitrospinaceae bacterium]NIR54168.1 HAMP domain-containing protein [Nitrospinaceae bacterium]NIS84586.1 HAMP domain-containing protein [Nitrospinaceae bacterium]NIT81378.1 HAMP domain-containing protein [Nitrospinaceae bacterium]NIU43665.1 HAMP domain-containing protein [Nitrospinaceae bacterium]
IQQLTDGLEKFAAGDLRSMEEMDVRSNDEIGRLSAAFNSLFHSVRTFLKNSTDLLNGVFPKSDDFGLKG